MVSAKEILAFPTGGKRWNLTRAQYVEDGLGFKDQKRAGLKLILLRTGDRPGMFGQLVLIGMIKDRIS